MSDRDRRQELLELLWSATDDLIYLTAEDGRLIQANPAFFEVLGYEWADFQDVEQRWQHIHPDDREPLADHLRAFLNSDQISSDKLQNRFLRPSGEALWVETSISKVEWQGERVLLFISRDIHERQRVVEALRDSERSFRAIFENAGIGIGLVGTDGRISTANPALSAMLGYTEAELEGMHFAEVIHPDDRESDLQTFGELFEGNQSVYRLEKRYRRRDGTTIWARLTVSLLSDVHGEPRYAVAMIEDVTSEHEAEAALQASETRFRELFKNSPDAIFVESYDGEILDVNPAGCELHGLTREELIGKDVMETIPPTHRDGARADFERLVAKDHDEFEGFSWTADGRAIPVEIRTNHIEYRGRPALLFHVRDITERKRFEARLEYLAEHDHLTRLHNRRRFETALEETLGRAQNGGLQGALLWIDIDRFKAINDRLGYKAGDELLVNLADMLTDHLREDDVVARVGGDEFAVLIPQAGRHQAEAVADKLLQAGHSHLAAPNEELIRSSISIGIVLFPIHGATSTDLLARVGRTIRQAKEEGGNRYRVYDPDEDDHAEGIDELNWAERIRDALENDRFRLHRQSVWDLRQDRGHGAELLLRMQGDDREILPGAFLESATRFGLMIAIDRWVVEAAIRVLAEDQRAGVYTCFEVNISAKAIGDAELLTFVEECLNRYDVDPTYLTVEVAEADAIANIHQTSRFIEHLKDLGCKFALDDFGVGFSTFHHLKDLPVDYLKIDGDFIRDLADEPLDQHIVRSIVQIAQAMGIQTIAECVEDEATFRLLKDYGIDYAQGFYIDRPTPVSIVSADELS